MATREHLPMSARRLILPITITLLLGAILTVAGIILTNSPDIRAAELGFLQQLSAAHTPFGNALALAINFGFSPYGAPVVVLVIAVPIAIVCRSIAPAVWFALLVGIPWLSIEVIKLIVQRPRPDMSALAEVLVKEPSSDSYPSGHTAFATALAMALILLLVHRHVRGARFLVVVVLGIVIAGTTAWSRLYLGVHQPTDVAASLIYVPVASVTTAMTLTWLAGRIRARRDRNPRV